MTKIRCGERRGERGEEREEEIRERREERRERREERRESREEKRNWREDRREDDPRPKFPDWCHSWSVIIFATYVSRVCIPVCGSYQV